MTMKTSSKKWQKIRKIKGLRQFVTWYPRHVSENPGYRAKDIVEYMHKEKAYTETRPGEIILFSLAKEIRKF